MPKRLKVVHIARILDRPTGPGYSVPRLLEAQRPFLDPLLVSLTPSALLEGKPYPAAALPELVRDPRTLFRPPFDRPDLAVFHGCFYPSYIGLSRALRSIGIPYVITPRGTFQKEALKRKALKKWLGLQLFFKPFIRKAAAIHFLTKEEAEGSKTWGRTSFTVPNGIDPVPAPLRGKPGKGKGLVFGFLGRVDMRHKGLDLLARAVALAQEDLRKRRVCVPVYGPDHEGTRERLSLLARNLGITDLLELKGTVRGGEKDRVLRGFDLFAHPSRHEGQPIAVMEALARGIPVLVTPGTNLTGVVRDADCGWAVDPDPSAIARALLEAAKDRAGLVRKGRKALTLSRTYDWRKVGRDCSLRYREVLGPRG